MALTANEKILVFIPCYNCAPQIPRVLAQFTQEYADLFAEILVIDNRSTDGTLEAAMAAAKNLPNYKVTVLQNDTNVNLGGSHKVTFDYAEKNGFDYAVILHGDDQGHIADLVPHLRAGAHRNVDFLLGARFLPASRTPGYSRLRVFGNLVFNALFSVISGKWIYDLGAGLNVFRLSALADKTYVRFPDRLTFNYYLLAWILLTQKTFAYFPLTWREEDQVSNARLLKLVEALVNVMAGYVFRGKKMLEKLPPPEHAYTATVKYQNTRPKVFILDVDGVMTDGSFYYTADGKVMKRFGSDDHDGLSLLKPHLEIRFVTGDHRGFEISRARIEKDMKMRLDLVSTTQRLAWIREHYNPAEVIYMGDGIFDHYVMQGVGYAIAPANADARAKSAAHFVTARGGGNRAVAEAALHILEKFFTPWNPAAPLPEKVNFSGAWGVK